MAFDNMLWFVDQKEREPFQVGIEKISDEALAITVTGEPDTDYLVQVSENMTDWLDVATGSYSNGRHRDGGADFTREIRFHQLQNHRKRAQFVQKGRILINTFRLLASLPTIR